jgi:hypothetical protein
MRWAISALPAIPESHSAFGVGCRDTSWQLDILVSEIDQVECLKNEADFAVRTAPVAVCQLVDRIPLSL